MTWTRTQLMAMYTAPFREDHGDFQNFIWDAEGQMVADMGGSIGPDRGNFRTRGMGKFRNTNNYDESIAGPLWDAMNELLLSIVKGCETDHKACVAALNAAWSNE